MLKTVSYSRLSVNSPYRPYLKVFFNNPVAKLTNARLALVDSGADTTLMPYSLGVKIGLQPASDTELKLSSGVVGSFLNVERDCEIALLGSENKSFFVFESNVSWAHPTEREVKALTSLYKLYRNITKDKAQDQSFKYVRDLILDIQGKYETNVLLGRNFFKNFDFLQFVEKSRGDASKFIYKVKETKVHRIVDL